MRTIHSFINRYLEPIPEDKVGVHPTDDKEFSHRERKFLKNYDPYTEYDAVQYAIDHFELRIKYVVENMKTNFGYVPTINGQDVEINSPAFFNEITKAAEKFLEDFGAYNSLKSATITDSVDVPEEVYGAFIDRVKEAISDRDLAQWAKVKMVKKNDGSVVWDLILTKFIEGTPHSGTISWVILYSPYKKNNYTLTDMKTNFGYTPAKINLELAPSTKGRLDLSASKVKEFFKEITYASKYFLSHDVPESTDLLSPSTKDYVSSYVNPGYQLSNWVDHTLGKIEPVIDRLQEEYNLTLERDIASKKDLNDKDSGKILYKGSYLDKLTFTDHLLELRVNFDRGDKFLVWIRPDNKGSESTKAEGQSDLSFFEKWVKDNVARYVLDEYGVLKTAYKTPDNFRQAVSKELINLGAIEGKVKGTLDISTAKIQDVTIDIKATKDKILVNAYRNGNIISQFSLDIAPFTENPVKVAKKILASLSKQIKESYPSIERQIPELNKYWDTLFDRLKLESGIYKQSNLNTHYLTIGSKRCKADFGSLGQVRLTNLFGREIAEEQFSADPRYIKEDMEQMRVMLESNKFKF